MVDRSLCENHRTLREPFFSICIPQYNRTDFLIAACESFASQKFRDFEVCISDDCSNDGKEGALLNHLKRLNLCFAYSRTESNIRYDANLRNAISLSKGKYLLLMGNDDAFSDSDALQAIHDELVRFEPVAAAITNYRELTSGKIYRRMTTTGVLGCGPRVAVLNFRNYSFLSGIIFRADAARRCATEAVDGSEMYQMFLGTRLVAAGGRLLAIDRVCIDKDVKVPGQVVDSYRTKPRLLSCPILERSLPMGRLLEVVAAGLDPHHEGADRQANLLRVARQLYRFTYPFWIVEYRRVQSWRYALGVFLALRPTRIIKGFSLSWCAKLRLWVSYMTGGLVALSIPIGAFDALRPHFYRLAKRIQIL
jgi:glycosyltransferase involved in cell wall biosynthesis